MNYKFKKISNNEVIDLSAYVEQYMTEKPETKLYVGCDSQNKGDFTEFAIVVVLHYKNKGGHVLCTIIKVPRIRDKFYRLFTEASYSLEIASYLKDMTGRMVDFVDLDLNPDPKFNSNAVLAQASGMITGCGFDVRCKPHALSASYAADRLCKK